MKLSEVAFSTPKYVLKDGSGCFGPKLVPLPSRHTCSAIYGFSDKAPYDSFCSHSVLPLTPYPLVRGYLRNQIEAAGDGITLVVIDANGPGEPCLQAATMEVVLDAQERKVNHVTAKYRLVLDQLARAYRVEEVDPQEQ